MSHSVCWPTKIDFYPIGNTSPTNLLQHIPPENDACILLLGCGDPRNILYTLYESGGNPASAERRLDFTCCDIEPGILARNILLFTLIAEGEHTKQPQVLWNIFYHLRLDSTSLSVLHEHAAKLAGSSVNLDTWHASTYADFIDITTTSTLAELHRYWTFYAETKVFLPSRREKFRKQFFSGMKKASQANFYISDAMISRSAGPCTAKAMQSSTEASRTFWTTGTTFTSQQDLDAAAKVNPTFAYSLEGERYAVHPSIHPLAAFHLLPVFSVSVENSPPTLGQIYASARAQFSAWCDTFCKCLRTPTRTLRLRFISVEALAFCEALQLKAACADPFIFPRIRPWRVTTLALDGRSYTAGSHPLTFDVIDTSTLSDTLGVVNVLVATRPLLKPSPSATLYTESLLMSGEDPLKAFPDSLCGDTTTMSLFFDLSPTSCLSGYNTQSNTHELIAFSIGTDQHYQERVTWKIPSFLNRATSHAPVPAFDMAQLATLLLEVYHKMFAHEDVAGSLRNAMALSIKTLQALEHVRYCRRSFTAFMRGLMQRVSVSAGRIELCDLFEVMVAADTTLLLGPSRHEDLLLQLHLAGLWSAESLLPGNTLRLANKYRGPFRDWSDVPPVVCVVFVVPRARLLPLDDAGAPVNPPLAAEFGTDRMTNYFCSFEPAFGTLAIEGAGEHARVVITEDPRGRDGGGDVVISVCVPAWLLVAPEMATMARLVLISTPSVTKLNSKYGARMIVHEVSLADSSLVHVLRERPIVPGGTPAAIPYPPRVEPPSAALVVNISTEGNRVDKMTRRMEIQEPTVKRDLASKDTSVVIRQAGASGIELSIGVASRTPLSFPFVVDATQAKLRVARKSSWIEVVASPCSPIRDDLPVEARFPLTVHAHSQSLWAIHRVTMDQLPILQTDNVSAEQIDWLKLHAVLAISDREGGARANGNSDIMGKLKGTIFTILEWAAGLSTQKIAVFELNNTPVGIDTLIFVQNLRLDLSAHAVVADAYVLTLSPALFAKIRHLLPRLSGCSEIDITPEEQAAWKYLLPSLAERCRTWIHAPSCEYRATGARIPLSTEFAQSPLCSCGQGKVSESFLANPTWAPFAPYVTRIALSPLFAVSYLESVGEKLEDLTTWARTVRREAQQQEQRSAGAAATAQEHAIRCGACGSPIAVERPMACSRCKKVAYCGRGCQSKDWKAHKQSCKAA
ncbi:DUF4470 and zf-MYND domain-containing protein [Phanerochaete sordida]|uniref:DUF4470 and zf-MYND domain-containing protein n=1 Tax=Phanerochaete sordida TaxID=48140 RepID=A0A9P3FXP5_9APHY|nr:DUF4470 and zf-MYND domain-containing protein [Phanerochaete sordida]